MVFGLKGSKAPWETVGDVLEQVMPTVKGAFNRRSLGLRSGFRPARSCCVLLEIRPVAHELISPVTSLPS